MEMVEHAQRPSAVDGRHASHSERLELSRPLGRERDAARSERRRDSGRNSSSVSAASPRTGQRSVPAAGDLGRLTTTTTRLEGWNVHRRVQRLSSGLRSADRFLRGRFVGQLCRDSTAPGKATAPLSLRDARDHGGERAISAVFAVLYRSDGRLGQCSAAAATPTSPCLERNKRLFAILFAPRFQPLITSGGGSCSSTSRTKPGPSRPWRRSRRPTAFSERPKMRFN